MRGDPQRRPKPLTLAALPFAWLIAGGGAINTGVTAMFACCRPVRFVLNVAEYSVLAERHSWAR